MFNGDISEAAPPSYAPCTAVRITPYADGEADHAQAVTYRFGMPITFVHCFRTRHLHLGTTASRDEQQMPSLVGFTVPEGYEEADTALALSRGLGQRRGMFAAVDLWSLSAHGYRYALIPFWKHLDLGEYPGFAERPEHRTVALGEYPGFAERPEHRTVALGESCAAPWPARWPRSAEALGPYSVERGVQMLLSTDADPPPAADLFDHSNGSA